MHNLVIDAIVFLLTIFGFLITLGTVGVQLLYFFTTSLGIIFLFVIFSIYLVKLINNNQSYANKHILKKPHRYQLLKISSILFSAKYQKNTFEPVMSDWDEEIYEALKENKNANLFMINVRNTYGFIMAMWQKSPIGDLLEYVRKFAS